MPLWLVVTLSCILPLAWMATQLLLHPHLMAEQQLSAYRLALLGRTLLYNGGVGLLACLLGWPAAVVIGRGRGWLSRFLLLLTPLCLLLPSLVYAYGWRQFIWQTLGRELYPGDPADIFRCIWTLACWLWPIAACGTGLSLRLLDSQLQQQALLDGVLWRMTLRELAAPIVASFAVVTLLAMQEFTVYETTGISVLATEVRTVFEEGVFGGADLSSRFAHALAAALPMVGGVMALAAAAWWMWGRRPSSVGGEVGGWPHILDAGWPAKLLAAGVVLLTAGVPLQAMIRSTWQRIGPIAAWEAVAPQITGSIAVAAVAGLLALFIAFAATLGGGRKLLIAAILSFLFGGQLLAIADIHLYNRRWLGWVYNGPAVMFLAYVGRFGWLALLAAQASWSRPMRELRDLGAVDGAGRTSTAWHIVWPLTWPVLGAAGVLVMIFSLTEVPATVLLNPQRPPLLIPLLMQWIHRLNDDQMMAASLLLSGVVVALGAIVLTLAWAALRLVGSLRRSAAVAAALLIASLCGCGRSDQPKAVWCETGNGPAQVIYPRAITYSRSDDSFYVVDRHARVQHLDHDGKFLNEWPMPEQRQGKPVGLSVGPDNNLYVADTHYARIMVYRPDGTLLRQWGSYGKGPGQFIFPTDIAFDSAGQVYVAEYGGNDRIQVFDAVGTFLRQFGREGAGPGEFCRPQSILIDPDRGDLLYVADACNHRIQVLKTDGTFVRSFGTVGSEPGQLRYPYGLDRDSRGNLIVCELGNNRVQKLDANTGRSLATWGRGGHEPGELADPWAVAVDKRDRAVVVDAHNNRLQVFEW